MQRISWWHRGPKPRHPWSLRGCGRGTGLGSTWVRLQDGEVRRLLQRGGGLRPRRPTPVLSSSSDRPLQPHLVHPGHVVAFPGHVIAPAGHIVAPTGLIVAPTGHTTASPGLIVASPGHTTAPPGHIMASPGHTMTSPGHTVALPGGDGSFPCLESLQAGPPSLVPCKGHQAARWQQGPAHPACTPAHVWHKDHPVPAREAKQIDFIGCRKPSGLGDGDPVPWPHQAASTLSLPGLSPSRFKPPRADRVGRGRDHAQGHGG